MRDSAQPIKGHKSISGRVLLLAIAKALEIPEDRLVRIVIDASFREVATVYIEQLGDDRLLEINWAAFKDAMRVKHVKDES